PEENLSIAGDVSLGDGDGDADDKVATVGDIKALIAEVLGQGKASNELMEAIESASFPKKTPKGFQKTETPKAEPAKEEATPKIHQTSNTLPKVTPKGFQKVVKPTSTPEVKVEATPAIKTGEATLPKITPKGFQVTKKPTTEAPTTATPALVAPVRVTETGTITKQKPLDHEKVKELAAVVLEGKTKNVKSFIQEARDAILNAKKAMN